MFPKPQKIVYHGDFSRCQRVRGDAVRLMTKLYESLGVANGQVKQGWRPAIPLYTGEVVQLHIGLALDTINIYAEGGEAVANIEVAEKVIRECLCNCNFTVGIITSAILSGTENTIYEDVGIADAPFYIYSVEVCQSKDHYELFENIIGSDFTPWVPGQVVLLMAYQGFSFGCCYPDQVETFGEAFASTYSATGCAGQISTVVDGSNFPDLSDHDWRPPFRILPFCGLTIPQWIEEKVRVN